MGGAAGVGEPGPEAGEVFGLGATAEIVPGGEWVVGGTVVGAPQVYAPVEVGLDINVDFQVEAGGRWFLAGVSLGGCRAGMLAPK